MRLLSIALAVAFYGLITPAHAQQAKPKTKAKAKTAAKAKTGTKQVKKNTIAYSVTPNGLKYKIIGKQTGKKPVVNDQLKMNFVIADHDSELVNTQKNMGGPVDMYLMAPSFKGDPMEGFALMTEGDSALFKVSADSFFRGGTQMPQGIKPGDMMDMRVKLVKVMSADDVAKERNEAQKKMQEQQADQLKKDTVQISEYLKQNHIQAKRTANGLYYVIHTQGTGAKAEPGKNVSVHYTGKLLDGKVFDSSRDRGEPISFRLGAGQVISGWDEGIALLNVGSSATLYIPSSMAYGSRGAGPIPANSVLIFDVELMKVE